MKEPFRSLSAHVVHALQERVKKAPRLEHCGLLLARPKTDLVQGYVEYFGRLKEREFLLPQEWLLETFLAQRTRGFRVAGFYHTHPEDARLEPSPRDLEGHPLGSLVLLVGRSDWKAYRAHRPHWTLLPLALVD